MERQIHCPFWLADRIGTAYVHPTGWASNHLHPLGVGAGLPACGRADLSLIILLVYIQHILPIVSLFRMYVCIYIYFTLLSYKSKLIYVALVISKKIKLIG